MYQNPFRLLNEAALRQALHICDSPIIIPLRTLAGVRGYFDEMIKAYSWSTIKVDRNGLQFFYKHVLDKQWAWVDIYPVIVP
jgi:integrase/recombinase XerD